MRVLFVHGMGRFPLSGALVLWHLHRAGLRPRTFGYFVSLDDFAAIRARLLARLIALAEEGDYVLVGHSLGGVLLRAALLDLPPAVRRPHHLFLLGSPVRPSRLAQQCGRWALFRAITRDCGCLLASPERMAAIGAGPDPVTAIVGVSGPRWRFPFEGEANDGVVSLAEVSAPWLTDLVQLPRLHTILPMSADAARLIAARLVQRGWPGSRAVGRTPDGF